MPSRCARSPDRSATGRESPDSRILDSKNPRKKRRSGDRHPMGPNLEIWTSEAFYLLHLIMDLYMLAAVPEGQDISCYLGSAPAGYGKLAAPARQASRNVQAGRHQVFLIP